MSTGAKPHAELDRVRPRAGGWLLLAALTILLIAAAIVVRPSWFRVGEERITADSIGASFNAVAELAVEEYVYSNVGSFDKEGLVPVSYTHLTLPTILRSCRSRWSPYH